VTLDVSTLVSFVTSELTAHGIMLFAGFTSSFTFLKLVYDYKWENVKAHVHCLKAFFVMIQGLLLSFPIYLLLRLIYYGALLNQINRFDNSITFNNYNDITEYFHGKTLQVLDLFTRWFTNQFFIYKVLVVLFIGCILSVIFLLPVIFNYKLSPISKSTSTKPQNQETKEQK